MNAPCGLEGHPKSIVVRCQDEKPVFRIQNAFRSPDILMHGSMQDPKFGSLVKPSMNKFVVLLPILMPLS